MPQFKTLASRILFILVGLICGVLLAWKNPDWLLKTKSQVSILFNYVNPNIDIWSSDYQLVNIPSSFDDNVQKAYFLSTKSSTPQPLIVSLHTWGSTYQENDSIALFSKEKNLNYIHPNFRGPNKTPYSCLSTHVIRDIDDAITFALKMGNVDSRQIHIIGKSGGGYAALGAYMKSKHQIKSVSSWVPITNLIEWYEEGLIRRNKYTVDILNCTASTNGHLNRDQAIAKSPIFWKTPIKKREHTRLMLYAGVFDGIRGSVPIGHSINFYNKIVKDFGATDSLYYVSLKENLKLLSKPTSIGQNSNIADRNVFLKKAYKNTELIIFEGGHEMLTEYAFEQLLKN